MENTATERFLEVIERLVESGKAKTVKAIIQKAQLSNSTITEIKQGRSKVSLPIIQKLVKAFPDDVDMNYILQGISVPVEQKQINDDSDIVKIALQLLKESVQVLKGEASVLNDNTKFLQNQLDAALKEVYSRDALIANHITGIKIPPNKDIKEPEFKKGTPENTPKRDSIEKKS